MARIFQRKERNDDRWWIEWLDGGKKCRKLIGRNKRDAVDALKVIEARLVRRKSQPHGES